MHSRWATVGVAADHTQLAFKVASSAAKRH
jgi:hypothetical protein